MIAFPARVDWFEFLARPPLPPTPAEIRDAHAATPLLITGAGGSIGSAMALRLARNSTQRLVLLDSSEVNLSRLRHAWEETLSLFTGKPAQATFLLGDAGNRTALTEIFVEHRPRLVFHAAAHKHVPELEERPLSAISNNILATDTVAAVAAEHGARVILLSTDKAVSPASVMGATKYVAEKIVQMHGGTVLRLGNVLASSGSVAEVFARQIANGDPLTVTDSAARRFFLTMDEAVDLLLGAAAHPGRGVVLAPAQLAEHNIASLAAFMARVLAPEREIPIRYVGLRPGEKVAERLWDDSEYACPLDLSGLLAIHAHRPHPAQFESDLVNLRRDLSRRDRAGALAQVCALVPGYQPSQTVRGLAGIEGDLVYA